MVGNGNGIQQHIAYLAAQHFQTETMLRIMSELSNKLGGVYNQKDACAHIWGASITPWDNNEGFDITLQVIPSDGYAKLQAVITALERALGCTFEKFRDYSEANWRPEVRILAKS